MLKPILSKIACFWTFLKDQQGELPKEHAKQNQSAHCGFNSWILTTPVDRSTSNRRCKTPEKDIRQQELFHQLT